MVFSRVFVMSFENAIIITLLIHTVHQGSENQTLAALCKAKLSFLRFHNSITPRVCMRDILYLL